MSGLVSVVVPTYNRAYCLSRTLDSVLAQTHQDFEVILVDDGSTDITEMLVRERYGHDPRIRYAYQENRGVASARNHGLRLARGDYIALLDSDDVWRPWKLELQLRCLAYLPHTGMVWTDMEAIDPDGRVFDPSYLRTMYSAYRWFRTEDLFDENHPLAGVWPEVPAELRTATLYIGEIFSQMIMGNLVHTSTVLLRRERFEKVRGFNEHLRISGEDYDFHLRTCREGRVAFVDVSSIQYQKGMPDRLTRPEYSLHIARNFLKTITSALSVLPPRFSARSRSAYHAFKRALVNRSSRAERL